MTDRRVKVAADNLNPRSVFYWVHNKTLPALQISQFSVELHSVAPVVNF